MFRSGLTSLFAIFYWVVTQYLLYHVIHATSVSERLKLSQPHILYVHVYTLYFLGILVDNTHCMVNQQTHTVYGCVQ